MVAQNDSAIQSKFYDSYKIIRNNFRKYNTQEVINYCIRYLSQRDPIGVEYLQLHPWLVLLLLKWVILEEPNSQNRESLTPQKFQKLIGLMFDLRDKARLPSETSDVTLFFRLIAYQQFIYQEEFRFSYIARQYFYFDSLPDQHFIKEVFLTEAGISISCFLELSIMLGSRFMNEKFITVSYFQPIFHIYSREMVKIFFELLTKDNKFIRNHLNKFNNGTRSVDEIYEQTYMVFFPLLKQGDTYICAEKHTLWRCIENFIYDFMKRWNAQKFMNEFGVIFEKTIELSIKNSGLIYYTESQIKECFKKGKFVDFIITEENSNIFIESKSVEMAYQGKVSDLTSVVIFWTKRFHRRTGI
jgi:hypothetical protein